MPAEHVWGYWTTVKRKDNFRALTNCVAERTYVAVGWGGTDWVIFRHLSWRRLFIKMFQNTDWSVMLRKNWENNANIRKPASCHGALPQLTPAKYFHAMASLDYTLIVCGGMLSK